MLLRNEKGQTSVELLIITLFVLVVCTVIISNFFPAEKSVVAVSLIKEASLQKLAEKDSFYYLKGIDGPKYSGNNIKFILDIEPKSGVALTQADLDSIGKKANDANIFEKIVIVELKT